MLIMTAEHCSSVEFLGVWYWALSFSYCILLS